MRTQLNLGSVENTWNNVNKLTTIARRQALRDDPENQAPNSAFSRLSPLKAESLELMVQVGINGLCEQEFADFKDLITSAGLSIYPNIWEAVKCNPGKPVFLIYFALRLDPLHLEKTDCFFVVGEEKVLQTAMHAMINQQILQH